jgi:CBS domain-containing protein
MKARDLMTTPVNVCSPGTNLATAAMEMWSSDCGALPVLLDDGKVVGMITDRDICMAAAMRHRDIAEIPVGSVITGTLESCKPDDDLADLLDTMKYAKVRRLPVVDGEGKLQGIVSINDIILQARVGGGDIAAPVSDDEVVEALKGISQHWLPMSIADDESKPEEPKRKAGRKSDLTETAEPSAK